MTSGRIEVLDRLCSFYSIRNQLGDSRTVGTRSDVRRRIMDARDISERRNRGWREILWLRLDFKCFARLVKFQVSY